ncbi:WD repeat-containing protein 18-like isoform X1 [Periplaneta americana]|uniref:WD repeat-containing protein 18-like isoform X1 n=1 Tax=Periplaneta americana TaxID=6978 RepID=UPI0037E90352
MSNSVEVVITSENSGQLWNACVWDPRVGTSLMTYKGGGVASPHSLCLLGKDYLVMGDNSKPLLHAWQLNSQQPVLAKGIRLVCPGRVTSLAVSPDGCYCVTGIAENLHVWQAASGCHLTVAVRHFQHVNCIRFTDDGSHFVSGGEDALVLVWSLAYLLSNNGGDVIGGQTEPRHVFSDHSLPVKDLYLGPGGIRARLISVSVDKTCKVYDMTSGTVLLTVVFDLILTAVTMSAAELEVFVGGVNGNIYQIGIHSPPRMRDHHLTKEQKEKVFSGHEKAITCLSASVDGLTLLSGSVDTRVMIWNIPSRMCIRVIHHKGQITNAFFTIAPKSIFSEEMKPSIVLRSFQKRTDAEESSLEISIRTTQDNLYEDDDKDFEDKQQSDIIGSNMIDAGGNGMVEQINALKKINSDLYNYTIEKILQPFNDVQVKTTTKTKPNMNQATSVSAMKNVKFSKIKKKSKKLKTKK